MICNGGAPATDVAGLSRLWAAARQGNGLDKLGEASRLGQAHHGEAVESGAVGAVMDHVRNLNVLLRAFLHSFVMFPQRRDGVVGSAKDRKETSIHQALWPQAKTGP